MWFNVVMATQVKTDDKSQSQTERHHVVRTAIAVIFGVLAFWLVLFGVVTVWLNRTVTDTSTFVSTVEPLAERPEVKDFIITKFDEQLRQSASGLELAHFTLSDNERAQKTDEQLKAASIIVINRAIAKTFDSEAFQQLWAASNRAAHKQLVTQLDSDNDTAVFDMSQTAAGVVALLKETRFAPLIERMNIPTDQFKLQLQSESLASVRNAYTLFKQGTIILIIVALACLVLAVVFSTHHIKTLRRILMGSGVGLLLMWLALTIAPARIAATTDPSSEALIQAVASVVLRDLRLTTLITGLVFVAIGIASEAYDMLRARSAKGD